MSKEKEQPTSTAPAESPAEVTTSVILRANSREELATQFAELKAKHDGKTLTAGAVAHPTEDGTYILRVDII